MDCSEVETHLTLFIGGDLEAPLAALVGAHLGACQACGLRLEAARGARSALLGLAELEGEAGGVDLWPALRASLVAEGLCHPSAAEPAAAASTPRRETGRLLRFSRAFAGVAAAALALLLWRPWMPETIDTGLGGTASEAPSVSVAPASNAPISIAPAPIGGSEMGSELDLAGLVVPAGGPGAAAEPVLPSFLELAPSAPGGLRRAGPEDQLLRNLARPFPADARRLHPIHLHGQGDPWALASDEGELR
jgi:hypothetical protein